MYVPRYYRRMLGVRGLVAAMTGKASGRPRLFAVQPADVKFPFHLRVPSSDVQTFEQVFVHREYDFHARRPPNTIVDGGANIGLASIYLANRYPSARIVAVEPEASNFHLLCENVKPYPTISPIRAAIWNENASVKIVDPGFGKWGFMTQAADRAQPSGPPIVDDVRAVTIDALMRECSMDHLDILKLDIEGAEREVFARPDAWIGHVDALIVELHERLKPGCNRTFYLNTRDFAHEWSRGENVYLTRPASCISPPE